MGWLEDIQNNRSRQVVQMAKSFGYDDTTIQKAEETDEEVDLFDGDGDSNKLMKRMNKAEDKTTNKSKDAYAGKSDMYKMKMLGLRKFNDQDLKTYIGVEDAENSYITNLDSGDVIISKTGEGFLVSKFPIDEKDEGDEKEATDLSEAIDIALQFKEDLKNEEDDPEQIMYKEAEKAFDDEINPFEKAAYEAEFGEDIEKAHQDGDMHANGKWVWRSSANGGKGDWRVAKSVSKQSEDNKPSSVQNNLISKLKGANEEVLNKIANKQLKGVNDELAAAAKKEIEDRKKPKVGDVSKLTANEKQMVDKVVSDGFKIVSNKYNDIEKMSLAKTPKGNWRCYYDGKDIGSTIVGKLITDSVVKKMGWEYQRISNKASNVVTHDIDGTKVTVLRNDNGSYTLEANGKKFKSDDPSFFVNGTNLKSRVKKALAKEVGIDVQTNK